MDAVAAESRGLDEDPVAFLARMQEECPGILSTLGASQARVLSASPLQPYPSENVDEEYLMDMGVVVSLRDRCLYGELGMSDRLFKPMYQGKHVDVGKYEDTVATVNKIVDRMKAVIEARLVVTAEKLGECCLPRIVRVAKKLKLTANETKLAINILVSQCKFDRGGRYTACDCMGLCQSLNIPLKEFLTFMAKDRIHIEQGFFPDVMDSYIMTSAIEYDRDICRVLMGMPLRDEEVLKFDQTVLAEVIAEEPGNEQYKAKDDESEETLELAPGGDSVGLGGPDKRAGGETDAEITKSQEFDDDDDAAADADSENGKAKPANLIDLDLILRMEREKEEIKKDTTEEGLEDKNLGEDTDKLKPYKKDLDYLDDFIQLIIYKMKVKGMDKRIEQEAQYDDMFGQSQKYSRQKREALTKEKVQEKKCKKRLALTKETGSWIPRLERMVESRNLCEFEKNILLALIGSSLQPTKFSTTESTIFRNQAQVGDLLQLFCGSLEDEIQHRKFFYKSASLVREGMVIVHSSGFNGDPTSATVEVDRRMLDFCVGLDTEFSEIVEGSHLYFPQTKFDHVILPKEQKQLILNTVSNFEGYRRCRKKMGLDDAITYGSGMVMLFHGQPGTGKTMMANALANKLGKKILLINFPSLGDMGAGENFKFIFREAKINDAILFFDECEAIFESRERGGHRVNLLLTEIERHDGLIILATNRPYDLDEAMHRRIMIALEFTQPDHLLRKHIWKSHMPELMELADDINLDDLAVRYELTGGYIKNAILSALSIAVSRDGDSPIVKQKDLLQGANLQLRGRLKMKDFDRRVVPNAGLDEVIVVESVLKQLKQIVQFEKARSVLFGQWGFARRNHKGLTVLLHGSPGTGKTLVAEAIGYEVGKPLKVINCGELLSKWVGESSKNIDIIFQEAHHQDAILVFDEAEGLFGQRTETTTSTDRYANIDVGVLLYHIERFSGIVVLTTNLISNIDMAFFRRLRFVIHMEIPPQPLRAKIWKLTIPAETPVGEDVNLEELARHEMSGGNIKNAVFRAAAEAALRFEDKRHLTMEDLEESCKEEIAKTATRLGFRRQDSDTRHMYN